MEKSFLKWAGGKYKVLGTLLPILDSFVDSEIKKQTFIEPFLGSGTVYLNFNRINSFILSDKNVVLVRIFEKLQHNSEKFINESSFYFKKEFNTVEKYKELVSVFNNGSLDVKANLFMYLNKHCFNGLMRFNNSGMFNTPFGRYLDPKYPLDAIEKMIEKIKKNETVFMNVDFRILLEAAEFGDIVYCDPPYVDAFTLYGKGGFTMEDQEELAILAKNAAIRGAKVIVSNNYTKVTKKLYNEASYIDVFDVQRTIAAKGTDRVKVQEVIAVYDY